MKAKTTNYLEIVQAEYVSGYKIRLTFNDEMVRVMDFEPFLRRAMNPDITKYRQLRNFKKFHLHYGDLMWGDFDMIFPIMDLYRGTLFKGEEDSPAFYQFNEKASPLSAARKIKPGATVSYKKPAKRKKK